MRYKHFNFLISSCYSLTIEREGVYIKKYSRENNVLKKYVTMNSYGTVRTYVRIDIEEL